jgi:hypothetical protein
MPETTTIPRFTPQTLADFYWLAVRRVSNESIPKITSIVAELPGGASLHCGMGDYPRAGLTTLVGTNMEIDATGHQVEVSADPDGWTYYRVKIDGLSVNWHTRAGIGPTIVGGGK